MNKLKKIRGSAILVVLLSSLAFITYTTTANIDQEHLLILQDRYQKDIKKYYEQDVNNVDQVYRDTVNFYNITNNNEVNIY